MTSLLTSRGSISIMILDTVSVIQSRIPHIIRRFIYHSIVFACAPVFCVTVLAAYQLYSHYIRRILVGIILYNYYFLEAYLFARSSTLIAQNCLGHGGLYEIYPERLTWTGYMLNSACRGTFDASHESLWTALTSMVFLLVLWFLLVSLICGLTCLSYYVFNGFSDSVSWLSIKDQLHAHVPESWKTKPSSDSIPSDPSKDLQQPQPNISRPSTLSTSAVRSVSTMPKSATQLSPAENPVATNPYISTTATAAQSAAGFRLQAIENEFGMLRTLLESNMWRIAGLENKLEASEAEVDMLRKSRSARVPPSQTIKHPVIVKAQTHDAATSPICPSPTKAQTHDVATSPIQDIEREKDAEETTDGSKAFEKVATATNYSLVSTDITDPTALPTKPRNRRKIRDKARRFPNGYPPPGGFPPRDGSTVTVIAPTDGAIATTDTLIVLTDAITTHKTPTRNVTSAFSLPPTPDPTPPKTSPFSSQKYEIDLIRNTLASPTKIRLLPTAREATSGPGAALSALAAPFEPGPTASLADIIVPTPKVTFSNTIAYTEASATSEESLSTGTPPPFTKPRNRRKIKNKARRFPNGFPPRVDSASQSDTLSTEVPANAQPSSTRFTSQIPTQSPHVPSSPFSVAKAAFATLPKPRTLSTASVPAHETYMEDSDLTGKPTPPQTPKSAPLTKMPWRVNARDNTILNAPNLEGMTRNEADIVLVTKEEIMKLKEWRSNAKALASIEGEIDESMNGVSAGNLTSIRASPRTQSRSLLQPSKANKNIRGVVLPSSPLSFGAMIPPTTAEISITNHEPRKGDEAVATTLQQLKETSSTISASSKVPASVTEIRDLAMELMEQKGLMEGMRKAIPSFPSKKMGLRSSRWSSQSPSPVTPEKMAGANLGPKAKVKVEVEEGEVGKGVVV